MSKKIWFPLIIAIIVILALTLVWNVCAKPSNPDELIFFYSESCPHCANVEEYFAANNISEKIPFKTLEVSRNQSNANQLAAKASACELDSSNVPVPLLWDGSDKKCIIGDQPIIDYFQTRLEQ